MRGAQWVTAASGTNPVTGVTYINSGTANPTGALTAVTYGSADSDNFAYNPNTGRRSSYQFSVNGVNDKGTLTWNANGTLSKLVVADSLAATLDSQTCNYLYDDLQRVSSANCGSPWAQSFTYDAFGNISKTGSSVFQPVYSTANTNQFSSIPGVTVSYDANGKLLTDNLNTYTWDTNWGNPASINTTNLIYDAIGQMVEQQNGTIYTQILYGPAGKTAIMNGQTLTKAFVNLPGGGTAIYTPSGLAQYRHADWLGSSRLTSTASRTVYSDSAYAPFGEQYAKTGMADASFTGDNADTTSTLYDFTFRENSPSQGRWISPDPAGVAAVDTANPQSWNRYAYVGNNPLSFVDPLGLETCAPAQGDTISCVMDGCGSGMTMYNNYCVPSCPGEGLAVVNGWTICGPPSAISFFQNQVIAGVNAPSGPANNGPSSDPCFNSSLAAVGVGPAELRQRITTANTQSLVGGLLGLLVGNPMGGALGAYARLVHTGGPQDDKNLPQNHSVFGHMPTAVAAGNISFGVTCPFGAAFCQFAAGAAQTLTLHGDPSGTLRTGYDTPSDNASIRVGQAMRAAGCHD